MMGLSSMALCADNPALAQEWNDDQPTPRDASPSRNQPGTHTGFLKPTGRSVAGDHQRQRPVSGLLLARQDGQGASKQPFDIPAGSLQSALQAFSRQVDVQIFYTSEEVAERQTSGVRGVYTPQAALDTLLSGTGLRSRFSDANTVTLQQAANVETNESAEEKADQKKVIKVPEIVVREAKERPAVDSPDGYKADVSSEAVLRFPARIQELPQSVSVVTEDSIRERRAVTQQEALEGVAGIVKQATFAGFQSDNYVIRGFHPNANVPGFTRDNGLVAFNNYVADPTLYDRIEVIKGAASFTSGLVAAGGFVNRLLKAPQFENFVVGEAGAGSHGHYRTTLDANGVMPNLPIAGRFVFTQNNDPEFFRNTGNQRFSFLPSVRFATANDFTLTVTGNVQRLRGKGYFGTPTNTQGMIPAGIEDSFLGNDNFIRLDYHSIHAEAEKKFVQGLRLKMKGQYSHDSTSYRYAYGYQSGGIGPDGNFYIYGWGRDIKRESFAGEVNLVKDFSLFGNLSSVSAGMDYSIGRQLRKNAGFISLGSGNISNPQVNTPFPPGFTDAATILNSDLRFNQTGAFLQGLLRPFAGTTLMVALRGNWITQQAEAPFVSGVGATDRIHVSRLTPQIGISQRIIEGLNVYASYGESIQPNFAISSNGSLLDPITGKTIEVGSKWAPFGGRIRLTAAFFRTELDNVATRDPAFPPNAGISIGGQSQRNQGFEFEARGAIFPNLQVNLAYTFLETAEVTKSTLPNVVGVRAWNTPTHTVSAFGSYDFSNLFAKGLKLGAVVFYRSEVNALVPLQNQTYEGYTRADLFAVYAPLPWLSFQVNLNNIANARYVEGPFNYASGNAFGAPRHVIGMLRIFWENL